MSATGSAAVTKKVIPSQICFDPEQIKAYVDGHLNWSIAEQKLEGVAAQRFTRDFYRGAVTALTCVFSKDNEAFPPQIPNAWITKAMGLAER